jgi:hypothetical protein
VQRDRPDWTGVALLALAAATLWLSQGPRSEQARWYAEAIDYNRAVTRFLVEHRDRLRGHTVAVFGVAGFSPWARNAGGYLTKLLGDGIDWRVYVPHEDAYYPFGRLGHGTIEVQAEAGACGPGPRNDMLYLAFDAAGRGTFASDCVDARNMVHRPSAASVP